MSFDRNARSTEDVELRAVRAAVEHQAKSVLITSLQAATRGRLSPETIRFAEKVYKRTLIELVAQALVTAAKAHIGSDGDLMREYKLMSTSQRNYNRALLDGVRVVVPKNECISTVQNIYQQEYTYDVFLNIVEKCLPPGATSITEAAMDTEHLNEMIRKCLNDHTKKCAPLKRQDKNEGLCSQIAYSLRVAFKPKAGVHEVRFDSELRSLKLHVEITKDSYKGQIGLQQFLEIRHGCALTGGPITKSRPIINVDELLERRGRLIRWMKMIHFFRDATGVPADVRCDGAVEQLCHRIRAIDCAVKYHPHTSRMVDDCLKESAFIRLLAVGEIAQFDPIVLPVISRLRLFTKPADFDSDFVQLSDRYLDTCRLYNL